MGVGDCQDQCCRKLDQVSASVPAAGMKDGCVLKIKKKG